MFDINTADIAGSREHQDNLCEKEIVFERKPGLYLKRVRGKGRGLFCKQAIAAGDVIDTSPSLHIPREQCDLIDKTALYSYYLQVNDGHRREDGGDDYEGYVICGLNQIVNHCHEPNAEQITAESDVGLLFILRALTDISPHTEISFRYLDDPLWFDYVE